MPISINHSRNDSGISLPSFRTICVMLGCLYLFYLFFFLYTKGPINSEHGNSITNQKRENAKGSAAIYDTILREITPELAQEEVSSEQIKFTRQLNKIKIGHKKRPMKCSGCFPHDFRYVIDQPNVCKQQDNGESIQLLVLIFSTHKNREMRDTVRKTWMSVAKGNTSPHVRYVFLLGETGDPTLAKDVHEESLIYGDIVKEDFIDSYLNLTYKTVMALKWATNKCPNAEFVMKTDDDMYVNVTSVLQTVENNREALQTSVGGNCKPRAWPQRDPESKWYASKEMYPHTMYPGYCSGSGYVTSMRMVKKIFAVSADIPYFHLEDIYVAFCIKELKLSVKHFPGFYGKLIEYDPCTYRNTPIVTSHAQKADVIKQMWETPCEETNPTP